MVAKFDGKKPSAGAANKPSGQPVPQAPKKVESRYSRQKAAGGSAYAGSNGQFNK